MAKIIEYTQQTSTPDASAAPAPYARPQDVSSLGDEGVGKLDQALQRTWSAVSISQEEQARAWSANAVTGAQLKWLQEFQDRSDNAQPGAPDFTPNLLKDYDEYAKTQVDAAPTPKSKMYLQTRLDAVRTMLGERAIAFEAKARQDYKIDNYNTSIDNAQKVVTTDPTQYQSTRDDLLGLIDSSRLPPIQKSALKERANTSLSLATVQSQLQKSPSGFLDSIGFNVALDGTKTRRSSGDLSGTTGNAAFDNLPYDKRMQVFNMAVQQKAQIDQDMAQAAAKRQKDLSDETAKTLWGAQADGKLTRATLEAARPILTVTEYKALLGSITGEGAQKSDAATFRRVWSSIAAGRYDEAMNDAVASQKAGLLSNSDMKSVIETARSYGRQDGPKSPYERAKGQIAVQLDPGPFVKDPEGKGRYGDALKEFDDWMIAHPKASDSDIETSSTNIINRYRFVNMHETLAGLPQPNSGAILPKNASDPKASMAAVANAMQQAKRMKENGTWSDQEYQNEVMLLSRWKKAYEGYGGGASGSFGVRK